MGFNKHNHCDLLLDFGINIQMDVEHIFFGENNLFGSYQVRLSHFHSVDL
jgi:hypothetical protein